MGNLISVWSTTKKQGKTMFIYSIINHMMNLVSKETNILLVCTNFGYGNLLNLFGVDNEGINLEDIVNFKIHPDNSLDMLNVISRKNNVYFLGSRVTNINYANRNMRIYESLLDEFKSNFDLIFIDTISGDENSLTNMILEKSDYVINLLAQDKEILDKYNFITNKDIAYIVNFYRDIYPNEKEFISTYKLNNVFTLPLCNELQEMKNKNKLELYIQHDTEYNTAIKNIAIFLAQKLKLDICKDKPSDEKRKGLLRGILGGMF